MGLGKYLKQKILVLYAKMVREKATPEYIARGWAIGMFCGCAIPFGLQLPISIPAAFILKGSKIGSVLGTLLTNHVTIWFIYPVQCYVGNKLIGGHLSYAAVKEKMARVIAEKSYEALLSLGGELAASFFIGGALMALVFTPLTYRGVKSLVIRRRARKEKKQKNPPQGENNKMDKALELFTASPRKHNCAQATACGLGHDELYAQLAACGGGKAPEGRCGALHAAMLIAGEARAEQIRKSFVAELGAETCAELKRSLGIPCAKCVETAVKLAEKLGK